MHQLAPQQTAQYKPIIRVDPQNRCAAMLIFSRQLLVFPFLRSQADQKEERKQVKFGDHACAQSSRIREPYVIDLQRVLDCKVVNVKDFAFLDGYYEPTVLILHSPKYTWGGRYAVTRNTCYLVAVNVALGAFPADDRHASRTVR